jgi:hypothetical protein
MTPTATVIRVTHGCPRSPLDGAGFDEAVEASPDPVESIAV